MNVECLSEEGLSALSYNSILQIAKEHNVYKRRSKKVTLIKRILSSVKTMGNFLVNNENQDPNDHKEEAEEFLNKISDEKEAKPNRRSTFTLDTVDDNGEGNKFECTLPTVIEEDIRRSTFTKEEAEEFLNKISDEKEAKPNRRSTFTLDTVDDNVEKFRMSLLPVSEECEMEEGRRLTFTTTPLNSASKSKVKEESVKLTASKGDKASRLEELSKSASVASKVKEGLRRSSVKRLTEGCGRTPRHNRSLNTTITLKTPSKESTVKKEHSVRFAETGRLSTPLPARKTPFRSTVVNTPRPATKTPGNLAANSRSTLVGSTVKKTPRPPTLAQTPRSAVLRSTVKTPRPATSAVKPRGSGVLHSTSRTPKTETKVVAITVRSSAKKMPNFSEIHARQFHKMESLVEARERQAKRALQLFSPVTKKTRSSIPVAVNRPKTILDKSSKGQVGGERKVGGGAAAPVRREPVKKAHLSSVEKTREASHSLIKGVRANKRFLLQMQARNITT